MPAIWEDDNGVSLYIPPPPPPPTAPRQSPQFKQAVNTAGAATTGLSKEPDKANRPRSTRLEYRPGDDCRQYRLL